MHEISRKFWCRDSMGVIPSEELVQDSIIILVVANLSTGGVQIWTRRLFAWLITEGHNARLWVLEQTDATTSLSSEELSRTHTGGLIDLICFAKNHQVKAIHFAAQEASAGAAIVKKYVGNTKVVVTTHAAVPFGWSTFSCDRMVAISGWLKKQTEITLGINTNLIYHGVDPAHFFPPAHFEDKPPILVWVGRASDPNKAIIELAKLSSILARKRIRLWVISPDNAKDVTYFDAENDLLPNVERWRRASPDEMPEIYRKVATSGGSIFVTSLREGLGMAAIEAQACGCTMVALRARGVNETACADASLLLDRAIPREALAESIAEWSLASQKQAARRLKCVEYVGANFNQSAVFEEYLHIYASSDSNLRIKRNPKARLIAFLSIVRHYYLGDWLEVQGAEAKVIRAIRNRKREIHTHQG
jgi:glycosyltransferase involved in cell wall biosynthesis